jgi:4-hydroxybenzoate polyprenyltransferase
LIGSDLASDNPFHSLLILTDPFGSYNLQKYSGFECDFMNTYIRTLRLPFLTVSLVPVLQAAALAHGDGSFSGLNLLLILIGVGALHRAGNLINDYIDTPRSDSLNPHFFWADPWPVGRMNPAS